MWSHTKLKTSEEGMEMPLGANPRTSSGSQDRPRSMGTLNNSLYHGHSWLWKQKKKSKLQKKWIINWNYNEERSAQGLPRKIRGEFLSYLGNSSHLRLRPWLIISKTYLYLAINHRQISITAAIALHKQNSGSECCRISFPLF